MPAPRMYTEIASWFHLLTAPEDYTGEAEVFIRVIRHFSPRAGTILELGSGGGNNASLLKKQFTMTLVDLSAEMLQASQGLNPELEHLQGDMRTVRLNRLFDVVFIHDAVMYMTTLEDLRLAVRTAAIHCKPGGLVLLVPDCTRETFKPVTNCGGHDGEERSLRYLEWSWDPDPTDTVFLTDYAYLLRDAYGSIRTLTDRHVEGLFSREEWLSVMREEGLHPQDLPFDGRDIEPDLGVIFLGMKSP